MRYVAAGTVGMRVGNGVRAAGNRGACESFGGSSGSLPSTGAISGNGRLVRVSAVPGLPDFKARTMYW